jgi:hypothetical protein
MNYSKKTSQNTNFNQSLQITSDSYDFMSKNIIRYTKSKAQTKKLLNFVDTLDDAEQEKKHLTKNVIESVEGCGSWLEFRNYIKVDQTKLHNANFCKKDKLCPACAMRRASKQVKKVMNYFEDNPSFKKKYWYYIVLPVKHNAAESFTTVFNRAKSGLESLRKSINNSKHRNTQESFFSQFDGLMYSFEVTKTQNGWNNHINLLCCSDTPVEGIYKKGNTTVHNGIMEDWAKYTDNKSYIHSINKIDVASEDELIKNLLEIFKYSMKFQGLEPKDLLEAYSSTYKKRLLGAFGSLYGIKTNVDMHGDEVLGKEFLEVIYRFNFETKKYFEHSRQLKEVDCRSTSYGEDNYKMVDVTMADLDEVIAKVPIKQKRVINHFEDDVKKKSSFRIDWLIFKETMKGLDDSS